MKAKLALLEASPFTSQSPKPFQLKNKCQVAKTFDWDEEEVSDDEEMTQVKVLMALADDELAVGNNHACNGEWIDITIRKMLKAKKEPFPPCTHCGFNDHRPDDCRNYPECEICGSYDHFTSGHNRVILVKEGVLAESSQSREFLVGMSCTTCGSNRQLIWYMDSGCSRSMTGVKSYLHKFVEQPSPKLDDKQGTIFNANKEIMLIAPRRNDVYVIDMSSLTPNGACFFSKASESVNGYGIKGYLT
ncbi:hypothetical protein Tco_0910163 [Tanacetum coccineum]|uniref:Uncharacterized protein n=1 Tax=Tanacetum coccineum TaxID=301880 RepID=A0ABQ5CSH2_9ASTR